MCGTAMSDELVDRLVVAAQIGIEDHLADAFLGDPQRQVGIALLERFTEPVLTDIAVDVVRAIVEEHPGSSVTVTQSWFDALPLDRSKLEKKTGLNPQGLKLVLQAMCVLLRTTKNVAELSGVRVSLFPEIPGTMIDL